MAKDRDIAEFLHELDAGVFPKKVVAALQEVASGVHDWDKQGEVTITMKVKPMNGGQQLMVEHDLKWVAPTKRGKKATNDTTHTPMYVGAGGWLTLYPEKQDDMFHGDEKRPQVTPIRRD